MEGRNRIPWAPAGLWLWPVLLPWGAPLPGQSKPGPTVAVESVRSLLVPVARARVGGDLRPHAKVSAHIAAVRGESARQAWVEGLVQVIADPATRPGGRRFAAEQLRKIAAPADVPRLTPLLLDPLAGPLVASVLVVLPGREAGVAIRGAVRKTDPATRVVLLRGLGRRRDTAAVRVLASQLGQRDFDLVRVAAAALGEIGGVAAERVLRGALQRALARRREEIGMALLRCGDLRRAAGDAAGAASLYRLLLGPDEAVGVRMMAARGLVGSDRRAAFATLAGLLVARDRRLAVLAAQELPGLSGLVLDKNGLDALRRLRVSPEILAILLDGFGRRGKTDAVGWVESVLDGLDARRRRTGSLSPGDRGTLGAALRALVQLCGQKTIPRLAKQLAAADPTVRRVIHELLVAMDGTSVELEIHRVLRQEELAVRARTALVRVIAARRTHAAVTVLLGVARGQKAFPVRMAALQGLLAQVDPGSRLGAPVGSGAQTGGGSARRGVVAIEDALDLWARPCVGQERAARNRLAAVSLRRGGAEALTRWVSLGEAVPAALRAAWFRVLRLAGGGPAAAAFARGSRAELPVDDPRIGDPDAYLLAELAAWPDAGALPVLAEWIRTADSAARRRATLAAYLRVLGRHQGSDGAAWRFAWDQLQSGEGPAVTSLRRRVLTGLGAAGDTAAFGVLRGALAAPALRDAAARGLRRLIERHPRGNGVAPAVRDLREHARDPELRAWADRFDADAAKR